MNISSFTIICSDFIMIHRISSRLYMSVLNKSVEHLSKFQKLAVTLYKRPRDILKLILRTVKMIL